MGKTLLGKLAPAAVGMMELPRLAPGIVAGFRALGDLTGTVSDALDECSIAGVALLRPTDPKARMVGQAITVENRRLEVLSRNSGLADIEAHNLADPGDVLVIQGVAGISSMGGISAAIGKRQGESGAVVDGAVRDIDRSRALGYPVWSSGVSPVTGKWRIETVAVNKPVSIGGVQVHPGDIVVADECGVCFVPYARVAEVLARARQIEQSEKLRLEKLAAGMPLSEFAALQKK
ncbi:MAG TPA: RraA family protein [Burkholderiales bacterium]|nr:RraA family protein [Burkholderiales bacterium]